MCIRYVPGLTICPRWSLPSHEDLSELIHDSGLLGSTGLIPLNHVPPSSEYLSIKVVITLPDKSKILIITLEFVGCVYV